ncbi:hypothetical protein A6P39_015945 [Streptomyces sp. FXJ1.172]|uniref:hypothetical protein n=1 Tax=Streptomyces sp. FXJ1.172 TaxID=710705 RepID=UPI0007CF9F04|nr:hypothetical protein [Streptomyces sp. FXJ1.172]WEO95394.1 hypothetical protein A6P39_015945 [Streptomyces sp. FXJ1.172]
MCRPSTLRRCAPAGGLVEVPSQEADDTTAGLTDHLALTDVSDLDQLIDDLVHQSWPKGRHTDDITLLLLRTTGTPGGTPARAVPKPARRPEVRKQARGGASGKPRGRC